MTAQRAEDVFTLLVQVGRSDGDGLPDEATGAALLCYASGRDEKAAVDATVQVLREAEMAPLEVESYGARSERLAAGEEIAPEDNALMDRALAENAVLVVSVTTFDD
ncbi:MAG: hypothetical protein AAF439_15010 [Pseudomonadota bacterium]